MDMRTQSSPAFEALYEEHGKRLLAFLWALGVTDPEERKDVAQEIWLTVSRKLEEQKPPSPRAWLGKIARNAVRTWRRTRKRRPEFGIRAGEGQEQIEARTPEAATQEAERLEAIRAFVAAAVHDEERREAFLLHTVLGATVAEVAEAMGLSLEKAEARLQMARRDIDRAREALSEGERDKLRAVVLPFASADALAEELRSAVSDGEVAEVRERMSDQLTRSGRDGAARHGDGEEGVRVAEAAPPAAPPAPPLASPLPPSVYVFSVGQVAGLFGGIFVVGVAVGVAVHELVLRKEPYRPPVTTVDAPAPKESVPERLPRPDPTASTVPQRASAQPTPNAPRLARVAPNAASSSGTGAAWEADALLGRARRTVVSAPRDALALVKEHATKYPESNAAQREEIEIRALVQLGERAAAEARALDLIQRAPSMRAPMEDLFDRRFP